MDIFYLIVGHTGKFRNADTGPEAPCRGLSPRGTRLWLASLVFSPPLGELHRPPTSACECTSAWGGHRAPCPSAWHSRSLTSSPCQPGCSGLEVTHGQRPVFPFSIKLGPAICAHWSRPEGRPIWKCDPYRGAWATGLNASPGLQAPSDPQAQALKILQFVRREVPCSPWPLRLGFLSLRPSFLSFFFFLSVTSNQRTPMGFPTCKGIKHERWERGFCLSGRKRPSRGPTGRGPRDTTAPTRLVF